ncbi:hypothetical protein Droror1_Dr00022151 [Drosera rotundifolia]
MDLVSLTTRMNDRSGLESVGAVKGTEVRRSWADMVMGESKKKDNPVSYVEVVKGNHVLNEEMFSRNRDLRNGLQLSREERRDAEIVLTNEVFNLNMNTGGIP